MTTPDTTWEKEFSPELLSDGMDVDWGKVKDFIRETRAAAYAEGHADELREALEAVDKMKNLYSLGACCHATLREVRIVLTVRLEGNNKKV